MGMGLQAALMTRACNWLIGAYHYEAVNGNFAIVGMW